VGVDHEKLQHFKGCKCKQSECQKKYCECFERGVACTDLCKCTRCKNTLDRAPLALDHQQPDATNEGEHLQPSHLPQLQASMASAEVIDVEMGSEGVAGADEK